MKNHIPSTLIALLLVAGIFDSRAADKNLKPISAASLNTIPVIGKLGVPLGQVATVRATVIDGNSLGNKDDSGWGRSIFR